MTPEELSQLAEQVWGKYWMRPLQRELSYADPRSVRYWKKGERAVPDDVAARLRALADIGPAGAIISKVVRKNISRIAPYSAHRIARESVAGLEKAGLLDRRR